MSLPYCTILRYIKYQKKYIYLAEAQDIWYIVDTHGFPFYHVSSKHLPFLGHDVYKVLRR